MDERDPLLEGLLAEARRDQDPRVADKQRVRASLMAAIAVGAPPSAGLPEMSGATTGGGATAGTAVGSAAKWWVVAALVAGGGVASMWSGGPASPVVEPPAAPTSAAEPVVASEPTLPVAVTPTPEPPTLEVVAPGLVAPQAHRDDSVAAVAPRARRRHPESVSAAPAPGPSPGAELALIRAATQALARHDGATAMRLLDAHSKQHAGGVFTLEADGLRVLAHCELGQFAVGRKARAEFLDRTPQAPLAARVRAACTSAKGSGGESR